MTQYAKMFNRVADCVERRTELLGRSPTLQDIPDQIAIRSKVFRKATVKAELAAVRNTIRNASHRDGILILDEAILQREWITNTTQEDLNQVQKSLERIMSDILDQADSIIEKDLETIGSGLTIGREEAMELIAGRAREDVDRFDQKDQKFITWRELRSIELELSSHDMIESVVSLGREGPVRIDGILRVFASVMWMTGMRPTEVWNCMLMVPRTDITFTPQMVDLVKYNPEKALLADYLVAIHVATAESGERNFGMAAANASFTTGAPCLLLIRSAKQSNANAAKRPVRVQILDRIPREQLNMIAIGSMLKYVRITDARKDNIRSSMGRALKKLVARLPGLSHRKINLYSFRHSFASRAKLIYEPHEAAALTGHTSHVSLFNYGERNLRSSKGRLKPEDWLPAPDPVQAQSIQSHWDRGQSYDRSEPELNDV